MEYVNLMQVRIPPSSIWLSCLGAQCDVAFVLRSVVVLGQEAATAAVAKLRLTCMDTSVCMSGSIKFAWWRGRRISRVVGILVCSALVVTARTPPTATTDGPTPPSPLIPPLVISSQPPLHSPPHTATIVRNCLSLYISFSYSWWCDFMYIYICNDEFSCFIFIFVCIFFSYDYQSQGYIFRQCVDGMWLVREE